MLRGYSLKGLEKTVLTALCAVLLCVTSCTEQELAYNRFCIEPEFRLQQPVTVTTKALTGTYNNYVPDAGELVYAYAYNYDPVSPATTGWVEGSFRKSTTGWSSSLEVDAGNKYMLFAYDAGGASGSGTPALESGNYSLTVDPMDIIAAGEPSISVASARSYYGNRNPELTNGQFDLGAITNVNNEPDKVCLAMNHLFAKASPQFKIDSRYAELRTVVITSVKAVTSQGSSSMTVRFAASPAPVWGSRTDKDIEIELMNQGDSIILDPDTFQAVNGFCYMPVTDLPVAFEVKYNVYRGPASELTQENAASRLVRIDQTARNAKVLPSGTGIPKAGTNYVIKATVAPTYLYVLSDDDVELELVIENDQ